MSGFKEISKEKYEAAIEEIRQIQEDDRRRAETGKIREIQLRFDVVKAASYDGQGAPIAMTEADWHTSLEEARREARS